MLESSYFLRVLQANKVEFFSGVPDSLLKNICAYITDNIEKKNHIIAANEGNALAVGIGYYLATNKLPLIYMQNSGLGNIINPLLSLADYEVYSIPMLLMIGWRGEPNVKDEPQHKKQGRITLDLLETMEIPYQVFSDETSEQEAKKMINKTIVLAKKNNKPYALVIRKNTFLDYKLQNNTISDFPLLREDAIKIIVDNLQNSDIVVATTGVASRELFEYREELKQSHKRDFLTVGGMGHANQIALGIALQKPQITVFCFDGDGAMLMHMGSLAINASMYCDNFKHIIFNNGAHDSVGGQTTVAHDIDVTAIAKACGYKKVLSVSNAQDIIVAIQEMNNFKGMCLLEIKVKKGFRKDLGRPTITPVDNKNNLMTFINNE